MWLEETALQKGVYEEDIKMFLIHISGQGTALQSVSPPLVVPAWKFGDWKYTSFCVTSNLSLATHHLRCIV